MPESTAGTDKGSAPGELAALLAAWRLEHGGSLLQAELRAFADGAALTGLPQLSALFCAHSPAAADIANRFIAAVASGLRDQPVAQLPLRHFANDHFATLVLQCAGSALLSLQALHRCAINLPPSAVFSPVETHERVLAGSGQAILLELSQRDGESCIHQISLALHSGVILTRAAVQQAKVITRVDQALLVLKLQRGQLGCQPSRMIDLRSGRAVQQAAGKLADTRLELAAAVLGRMERSDAAPWLASAALESHGPAARWQALREALALDSNAGFGALTAIAARSADPLAAPAQALREQLLVTWPRLRDCAPCP